MLQHDHAAVTVSWYSRSIMAETLRTTCNRDCPDACGIVATVEDGLVTRIRGDADHPVTRGFLCWRTNHYLATQYSPERLTTPLLRKDGELLPVSWDEALDFVAERLLAIRRESGPASIFHYRSGGSLGILKTLCDLFFERFGPVTVKRGDICSGGGDAAQMLDFGREESHDLFDLLNARHIVLWGKNVVVSSPHTIPVLKEAVKRGAELVYVDPVHTRSAELCHRYVQPRPAGDFALAMAVARVLAENEWIDPAARDYCDHLEEFLALARSRTVAQWCARAGVAASEAEDLARRFGPGKPTATLVGWGMARRTSGAAIVRSLDALAAISGNLGIPGGGVSYYYFRRGAFDLSFVRGAAAAPRTICEPLFGEAVEQANDPPIRAIWVTAGNPVAMLPDSGAVARALETRELVVVVDLFLTDTARRAHVVLPTTSLLEADDVVGAYGHHWIGVARPVVPPPPGVRSDLEILQALAARVGLDGLLDGSPRDWKRRVLRASAVDQGLTLEALEEGAQRNPLPGRVLFADRHFPTASGKVNLVTEEPRPAAAPDGYPLWLLSLSTERSQSSQWAEAQHGLTVATVHPDAVPGLADGAIARLETELGAMRVQVAHDPAQRRDVVIVPKGGHYDAGRAANALIRARTTDLGEGGALYDERARLTPER